MASDSRNNMRPLGEKPSIWLIGFTMSFSALCKLIFFYLVYSYGHGRPPVPQEKPFYGQETPVSVSLSLQACKQLLTKSAKMPVYSRFARFLPWQEMPAAEVRGGIRRYPDQNLRTGAAAAALPIAARLRVT